MNDMKVVHWTCPRRHCKHENQSIAETRVVCAQCDFRFSIEELDNPVIIDYKQQWLGEEADGGDDDQ